MVPREDEETRIDGQSSARINAICSSVSLRGEKGLPKVSMSNWGESGRAATMAVPVGIVLLPARRAAKGGATGVGSAEELAGR